MCIAIDFETLVVVPTLYQEKIPYSQCEECSLHHVHSFLADDDQSSFEFRPSRIIGMESRETKPNRYCTVLVFRHLPRLEFTMGWPRFMSGVIQHPSRESSGSDRPFAIATRPLPSVDCKCTESFGIIDKVQYHKKGCHGL